MDNYERQNRIEVALKLKGMKAVELCEKANISKSSLSHWMKQHWQPKQNALMAMARALDVSEMWLAGYDVDIKRPVEQVRMDKLAQHVHRLKGDDRLLNISISICSLNSDQLTIVENMVNEFNKINSH